LDFLEISNNLVNADLGIVFPNSVPHGVVTICNNPEVSEPRAGFCWRSWRKTKSLGDLWCLMVVYMTLNTDHGGISSETECSQDRTEVGAPQAADRETPGGCPRDAFPADVFLRTAGTEFGGIEV
jgi:hypothetical protein